MEKGDIWDPEMEMSIAWQGISSGGTRSGGKPMNIKVNKPI